MAHYLVEEATTESVAASDPFAGHGVFLALAAGAGDILGALERAFGQLVPAVACPGAGAWVDSREVDGTKARITSAWEGANAGTSTPAVRDDRS